MALSPSLLFVRLFCFLMYWLDFGHTQPPLSKIENDSHDISSIVVLAILEASLDCVPAVITSRLVCASSERGKVARFGIASRIHV